MVLSELLRAEVFDNEGRRMGRVRDIRVVQTPADPGKRAKVRLKVSMLLVGPGGLAERLGYTYGPVTGPWLLRVLLRRRGHHLKGVPWGAIASIEDDRVELSVGADDLRHPHEDDEG